MAIQTQTNQVKVWDILIRVFHWSLVISFVITYFTGEDDNPWHIYFGYGIAGLIVFRFIWGFIGSKYARFSDFIHSPSQVVEYLKNLVSAHPKHYLGHNPAGGYMVMALLFMLTITTITGLKVYGVEGHGPLADANDISLISVAYADDDEHEDHKNGESAEEEFWEEVHELAANFTVLLIFLHIAGVLVSGRLHKENLVKAMLTGKKRKKD